VLPPAHPLAVGRAPGGHCLTGPNYNHQNPILGASHSQRRNPPGPRSVCEQGVSLLWARGGLISYGPNNTNQFHRAADYVDKILRGTKPADNPVEQPTKIELVIDLTTAKTLGLAVPESLLLRADEVIE